MQYWAFWTFRGSSGKFRTPAVPLSHLHWSTAGANPLSRKQHDLLHHFLPFFIRLTSADRWLLPRLLTSPHLTKLLPHAPPHCLLTQPPPPPPPQHRCTRPARRSSLAAAWRHITRRHSCLEMLLLPHYLFLLFPMTGCGAQRQRR